MRKICARCGKRKDREKSFYKHLTMADGYLSFCKSCVKERVAEHRSAFIERIREYDRERGRSPKRMAKARLNSQAYRQTAEGQAVAVRYRERNPEKYRAVTIANNAVRDGKLKRQPCEKCGQQKAEKHHDDYSKPLIVRWLCRKCHGAKHRQYETVPR
jgi:ribosomal protein S27AE